MIGCKHGQPNSGVSCVACNRERIAELEARQDQLIQFISELKLTDKQIDRFCAITKVDKAALGLEGEQCQ